MCYVAVLDSLDQREAVMKSIEDFRRFREENPELMGEAEP